MAKSKNKSKRNRRTPRKYKRSFTKNTKHNKRSKKKSSKAVKTRRSSGGGGGSCRGKFRRSTARGKKYAVEVMKNGKPKTINFGALGYQHYKDKTPLKLYSKLNHNDPVRRASYRARHSGIYTKSGKRAINDKGQAAYWSYHCLW